MSITTVTSMAMNNPPPMPAPMITVMLLLLGGTGGVVTLVLEVIGSAEVETVSSSVGLIVDVTVPVHVYCH